MLNAFGNRSTSDTGVIGIPWWKIAALGATFFTYLFTASTGHDWSGDFSQYIHHAVNLVEGHPYSDIGYIYNPFMHRPSAYPPLFPATLAPVYYFFGLNWVALKAVGIAAFCLAIYYAITLHGNRLGAIHQFAIIIVLALNPYFIRLKDQVLSEFVFTLICLLTLSVLAKRYSKVSGGYRDSRNKSWAYAVPMGLLLYLSYATREIGIVIIPAVLLFEIVYFRKISLVTCVAVLLFLLLAGMQNAWLKDPVVDVEMNQRITELAQEQGASMAQTQVSNIEYITLDIKNVVKQVVRYSADARQLWPDSGGAFIGAASWIAFILALLFASAGYIKAVFAGPGLLEIFVAGYIAALVLYGGYQGMRYIAPVVPILFFYAFQYHHYLLRSKYRKIMIAIAVLFLGTTTVTYASSYHAYLKMQDSGITSPDARALFEYVGESTPVDSSFIFGKPRVLALLTNRSVAGWPAKPRKEDPEFLSKYMSAIGAEYLVYSYIDSEGNSHPISRIKPPEGNYQPMAQVIPPEGNFQLEFKNDSFYIYKLDAK